MESPFIFSKALWISFSINSLFMSLAYFLIVYQFIPQSILRAYYVPGSFVETIMQRVDKVPWIMEFTI